MPINTAEAFAQATELEIEFDKHEKLIAAKTAAEFDCTTDEEYLINIIDERSLWAKKAHQFYDEVFELSDNESLRNRAMTLKFLAETVISTQLSSHLILSVHSKPIDLALEERIKIEQKLIRILNELAAAHYAINFLARKAQRAAESRHRFPPEIAAQLEAVDSDFSSEDTESDSDPTSESTAVGQETRIHNADNLDDYFLDSWSVITDVMKTMDYFEPPPVYANLPDNNIFDIIQRLNFQIKLLSKNIEKFNAMFRETDLNVAKLLAYLNKFTHIQITVPLQTINPEADLTSEFIASIKILSAQEQFGLGLRYFLGAASTANMGKAICALTHASADNFAPAAFLLYRIYTVGIGTEASEEQAALYQKKFTDLGYFYPYQFAPSNERTYCSPYLLGSALHGYREAYAKLASDNLLAEQKWLYRLEALAWTAKSKKYIPLQFSNYAESKIVTFPEVALEKLGLSKASPKVQEFYLNIIYKYNIEYASKKSDDKSYAIYNIINEASGEIETSGLELNPENIFNYIAAEAEAVPDDVARISKKILYLNRLAILHCLGFGTPRNLEKAIELFQLSKRIFEQNKQAIQEYAATEYKQTIKAVIESYITKYKREVWPIIIEQTTQFFHKEPRLIDKTDTELAKLLEKLTQELECICQLKPLDSVSGALISQQSADASRPLCLIRSDFDMSDFDELDSEDNEAILNAFAHEIKKKFLVPLYERFMNNLNSDYYRDSTARYHYTLHYLFDLAQSKPSLLPASYFSIQDLRANFNVRGDNTPHPYGLVIFFNLAKERNLQLARRIYDKYRLILAFGDTPQISLAEIIPTKAPLLMLMATPPQATSTVNPFSMFSVMHRIDGRASLSAARVEVLPDEEGECSELPHKF